MVFNYCIHIAYFILYIDKIFCFLVSDNNQNVVLLYIFTNSLNNFMHLIILVTPYFVLSYNISAFADIYIISHNFYIVNTISSFY